MPIKFLDEPTQEKKSSIRFLDDEQTPSVRFLDGPGVGPTPQDLKEIIHAPGSDYIPSSEEAASLRAHEQNRPLTDKLVGAAGSAWMAGQQLPGQLFDLGKQAIEHFVTNPQKPVEQFIGGGWTVAEGTARGGLDLGTMALKGAQKLKDNPRPLLPLWAQPFVEGDTDEKYYQRLLTNLELERQRQRMVEGKESVIPFPENGPKINPAGAELLSYALDPTVIAPAIKLPAVISRGMGQAAKTGIKGAAQAVETAGGAVNKVAKIPEQAAKAAVDRFLPQAEGVVPLGTSGAALAGAMGFGGPLAKGAAALKGAQIAGKTAEKAGEFAKNLTKTHGDSSFSRLEQLAQSEGSPDWVRGAARNLARLKVDKAAGAVKDVAGSAAKGAAIGAAITAPGAETAEEVGAGIGTGVTIGTMAHVALAPFTSGSRKRAAEDSDIVRWYSSKSPEDQAAVSAWGLSRDEALKALTAEAVANGVLSPNANLPFHFLREAEFAPRFGHTRGVHTDAEGVFINVDRAKPRTIYHELFHGLDRLPEVVDFGALNNLLFSVEQDGQTLRPGLIPQKELKNFSDQYFSRFDEVGKQALANEKAAFDTDPNSDAAAPWKIRISREIAAELFANLADETAGSLIKTSRSLGQKLVDKLLLAENETLNAWGQKLSPEAAVFSDIFPNLKATPEIYAQFREFVRNKTDLGKKPEVEDGTDYNEVSVSPRDALKKGGQKIAEKFKDNDNFKKNPDGSLMRDATGNYVLLTEQEIKQLQAKRAQAMLDAMAKVKDQGEPGAVREKAGGFEGRVFTPEQVAELSKLPGDIFTPAMKAKLAQMNELAGDGNTIKLDYNAATSERRAKKAGGVTRRGGRRYSSKISSSTRVVAPISFRVSKAGNFLVTGVDIGKLNSKIGRWFREKPKAFADFESEQHFMNSLGQLLKNHEQGIEGRTGLDADPAKAKRMADRIFDVVNIRDKASEPNNPDRLSVDSDKDIIIRSFRFDRINSIEPAGGDKFPLNYQLQKENFSPWTRKQGEEFAELIGAEIVGSVARRGMSEHDLDLRVSPYNHERISSLLKQAGFEYHGSGVVSPKEAKKARKNFGEGWARNHYFRNPNTDQTIEVWHQEGDGYAYPPKHPTRADDQKAASDKLSFSPDFTSADSAYDDQGNLRPKSFFPPGTQILGAYENGDLVGSAAFQNGDSTLDVTHIFGRRPEIKDRLIQRLEETHPGATVEAPKVSFSPDAPEPLSEKPFFSQLQKTVENKVQGAQIPAAQLAAILRNPQNGVKAEELKWSGIEEWLKGKGGKVAKSEVMEFLRANELKIEEVEKGVGRSPYKMNFERDGVHIIDTRTGEEVFKAEDQEQAQTWLEMNSPETQGGDPKFGNYQIPGGENYREILFTLPQKQPELPAGYTVEKLKGNPWGGSSAISFEYYNVKFPDGRYAGDFGKTPEEAIAKAKESIAKGVGYSDLRGEYKSSHWDEPNVIAHTRVNERTAADGKKVLFAEEVQSDWHQEGRKKGYREPKDPATDEALKKLDAEKALWEGRLSERREQLAEAKDAETAIRESILERLHGASSMFNHVEARKLSSAEFPDYLNLADAEKKTLAEAHEKRRKAAAYVGAAEAELNYVEGRRKDIFSAERKRQMEKVPDAPLKTTWHEFVFKRLLREAAEKGFDYLGWTPGEVQAERYDLSKQVSRIKYDPEAEILRAWQNLDDPESFEPAINQLDVTPEKLPDFIGKEAADRILNSPTRKDGQAHILEGVDLKVGGEGMKGFYDKMLVDFARKYGKKWGAIVRPIEVLTGPAENKNWTEAHTDSRRGKSGSEKIWAIDITPAMKKAVLTEGQPMFSPDVSARARQLKAEGKSVPLIARELKLKAGEVSAILKSGDRDEKIAEKSLTE